MIDQPHAAVGLEPLAESAKQVQRCGHTHSDQPRAGARDRLRKQMSASSNPGSDLVVRRGLPASTDPEESLARCHRGAAANHAEDELVTSVNPSTSRGGL